MRVASFYRRTTLYKHPPAPFKGGKALGVEFHRQVPILEYIVDFYCHELALAIEVDGNIHEFRFLEDCQRQEVIEKYGVTFVRFSNEQINTNLFGVLSSLESIVSTLRENRIEEI